MTVNELIEALRGVDGDALVTIEEVGDGYFGNLLYIDALSAGQLILLGESSLDI